MRIFTSKQEELDTTSHKLLFRLQKKAARVILALRTTDPRTVKWLTICDEVNGK